MEKHLPTRKYTAAGGVVVDAAGENVLVLLRPDRPGPDGSPEVRLPKGHIEPQEGRHQAALREIYEETGIERLQIVAPLGHQNVEYDWKGFHYIRDEYYFLMAAPPGSQPYDPEDEFQPEWLSWNKALKQLTFDAEREWVQRARAAWARTRTSAPPPAEEEAGPDAE